MTNHIADIEPEMTDWLIAAGERLHRNEESRIRRRLAREGLALRKSRTRNPTAVDYGTYMILDINSNTVVAGPGLIIDNIAFALETLS